MITVARHNWSLPARSLLIILLPLFVFAASGILSWYVGNPAGYFPQPSLQSATAEAAGRTKTIAAFLLAAGLSVGVLVASASALRLLDRSSRNWLLVTYLVTLALGLAVVVGTRAFYGAPYLDQGFACSSLSRLEMTPLEPAATGPERHNVPLLAGKTAKTAKSPPRRLEPLDFNPADGCGAPQFHTLQTLLRILGVLVLFAMPAVIFGAITCLAAPVAGSPEERLEAWTLQTRRLNNFLYLAAAYLVSGLLFTSCQLNWLAYSLHPDDVGPYRAYVSAIMLHGGISNTLIIASYYLPLATWLAAIRPEEAKAVRPVRPAKGAAAPALPDPFAPLRIAATIFAPALVGLLGELLKLG